MNLFWNIDIPEKLDDLSDMTQASDITTAQVCDAIGRSTIARSLGVKVTAVSNAVTDGKFPARWFLVINKFCEGDGIPCPDRLFSFVGADAVGRQISIQRRCR
ncbi:hypothetical protein [Paracoccus saliphilus]|uniref:Uncharacterized protein n=1 Tax=Paracoccus saliphilus TaxID=405559 RepID=A0ABY7SFZ5_9RHOB|nr:hypothetical protein [Paracoccus saliphilus]WCR04791.1 hypothetical protein JHX88_08800 [Paracoccus saliphilus]